MNLETKKPGNGGDNSKPVISAKCDVLVGKNTFCGKPTAKVYPALGGGYQTLCAEHGRKHREAWPIQEVDCVLV
jgi:hypothetical protein